MKTWDLIRDRIQSVVEQNQMKQKSQKWEVKTEGMQEEEYKSNTTLNV